MHTCYMQLLWIVHNTHDALLSALLRCDVFCQCQVMLRKGGKDDEIKCTRLILKALKGLKL